MYLGIDASLNRTGLCLFRGEGNFLTSTIIPGKDSRGPERLKYNKRKLQEYLDYHKAIKAIALEGYSFGSSGKIADIAEWGGIIRLELYERRIPTLIVPPQTLKKYILPATSKDKSQIVMQVYKQYGVECGTDDEADALVLSDMARYFFKGIKRNLTLRQQEALQKSCVLIPKNAPRIR